MDSAVEGKHQAPSNNSIATKDLECPICKQCYVNPRVYPQCGHSLCEECHRDYDKETDTRNCHTLRVYKCPMCRKTTLKPWFRRRVNQVLKTLASTHPGYNSRLKCHEDTKVVTRDIATNFDLGRMAQSERIRVAMEVYDEILPLLYDEALSGNGTIYIECKDTIKKMELCLDILTVMLFRHNIYKVVVRAREAMIYLTRNAGYINREYINPNHSLTSSQSAAGSDEDDDQTENTDELAGSPTIDSLTTEASTLTARPLFTTASALLAITGTGLPYHRRVFSNGATTLLQPLPPPPPPMDTTETAATTASDREWRYSLRSSSRRDGTSAMRRTMDILRAHREDGNDELQ